MNSNHGNSVFPFERNRYYSGKMLTSADFAAEQRYVVDKNRFMNKMMFGDGIVCGCNVYNLDDTSIFMESGLAIDHQGREIIVDTSVVKKLSAIPGFEKSESDCLTLCLQYKEKQVHPVYAVSKSSTDGEYEHNRIQEGYELFLIDTETKEKDRDIEDGFLAEDIIYQDDDYSLSLIMPATVCQKRHVKLQLKVEKLSNQRVNLAFEGTIQTPSFLTMEGNHEMQVLLPEMCLNKGETVSREYWVFVPEMQTEETSLILKKGTIKVQEERKEMVSDFAMSVLVANVHPRELVNQEIGKLNLEPQEESTADYIRLADIYLLRTENAYIIEKVEEKKVKKYIETPAQNFIRNEYLDFFGNAGIPKTSVKEPVFSESFYPESSFGENKIQMTTGTLEIPVGGKARPGEVFYSGEIMHGLGAGCVYIEIGQEFMEEGIAKGANTRSTVFGNSKLFEQPGRYLPKSETAVKVFNDKGSFVAAVSFAEETDCLMLTYHWVAVKFAGNDTPQIEENTEKQWIEAETPTVVLEPKESYYFGVKFHEMEKCGISYQVTEEDGGQITMDGVYTAPNKEGVYEIMISCMERPYICTYAYAIVKKK